MFEIRKAKLQDVGTILQMIRGMAEYERVPHLAEATEADLLRDG